MRSPASQILETALALRRAPGERFRLLAQPLPPDILHLIEVAAGAPAALREAAADLGEAEPVVLEAARFYLEQMLFAAPDADAYRILGVDPRAPLDEIRLHHRLLQRWLHPDRALAGDASVFATRVNQAWSRLRSPALRHDYDVGLAEARLANAGAAVPAEMYRRWDDQVDISRHGRRSRWLFAAALASCAVLAVLIMRHEDAATGPGWDAPAMASAPEEPVAGEGSDIAPLRRALAGAPAGAEQPVVSAPAPQRVVAPKVASPPRDAPAVVSRDRVATSVAIRQAPTLRPRPAAPYAPSASIGRSAAPRSPSPAVATVAATGNPIARDQPRPGPTGSPIPAAAPSNPQVARAPTAMAVAEVVEAPAVTTTPAPPANDGDPAVLLDRMHKAEQRVAQVAAYLSATPGAAPPWNDVRAEADADRLRQRLAVRDGSVIQFVAPNWQLRPDNANFSGTYRCSRCGIREGRLEVQLVWREGLWLVRGIGLGPSA